MEIFCERFFFLPNLGAGFFLQKSEGKKAGGKRKEETLLETKISARLANSYLHILILW